MRLTPAADVPYWLETVAEVLSDISNAQYPPYTIGDMLIDLKSFSEANKDSWNKKHIQEVRKAFISEFNILLEPLGERFKNLVRENPLFDSFSTNHLGAHETIDFSDRFLQIWASKRAIEVSFLDLYETAKDQSKTTQDLKHIANLLPAQLSSAADDPSSVLNRVADILYSTPDYLVSRQIVPPDSDLSEKARINKAVETFTDSSRAHIVVWQVFDNARLQNLQIKIGPVTLYDARWIIYQYNSESLSQLPEINEIHELEQAGWMPRLLDELSTSTEPLVLARVNLGYRPVAGAFVEAKNYLQAITGIATTRGASSWYDHGMIGILTNGKFSSAKFGCPARTKLTEQDNYGIEAAADILSYISDELDVSLDKTPFPFELVEAIAALKDASLASHRDTMFSGQRPTSPRVATALEDHAMELISSFLEISPKQLSELMQRREGQNIANNLIASQIISPFRSMWFSGKSFELRNKISKADKSGVLRVSYKAAVENKEDILQLPMTQLQRADFLHAIDICTNPAKEKKLLEKTMAQAEMFRRRTRRVRNAINHGLNLRTQTLLNIRKYSSKISLDALDLALYAFKTGIRGQELLDSENILIEIRENRIEAGISWVNERNSYQ